MGNSISGKKLFKILLVKFFTNTAISCIINIIIPILISVFCTINKNKTQIYIFVSSLCILVIIFNIISSFIKKRENKNFDYLNLIFKCYNDQMLVNSTATTNIYRLNKTITEYLNEKKPVDKKTFDKIADFQTTAFIISESIHSLLKDEFGEDIKCQVTIMKKETESNIKMIAYANNNKKIPSSYNKKYHIDDEDIYFVKIFKDLNSEICCLSNKKEVQNNFKKFKGSKTREEDICQYIGIPIKTNRNDVELLLQVDVSKEKIFGKNHSEVLLFARNILYPYAVLLHKSYERDLIFCKFYDTITMLFLNKQDN